MAIVFLIHINGLIAVLKLGTKYAYISLKLIIKQRRFKPLQGKSAFFFALLVLN